MFFPGGDLGCLAVHGTINDVATAVRSDTAPLHTLVADMLAAAPSGAIHMLRDPTRGGLATALNEIARASQVGMTLDEAQIPVAPPVAAACEMLGLDPL